MVTGNLRDPNEIFISEDDESEDDIEMQMQEYDDSSVEEFDHSDDD